MSDTNIILLFIGLIIALLVGVLIPTLLELRKTAAQSTRTLKEIDEAMMVVRAIAEDINDVTRNAKDLSSSMVDLARNVRAAGGTVEELTSNASKKFSGVRAGIKAACEVIFSNLIDNLFTRGGGEK
jgi:uncharacterized protein YoxC